MRILIADDHPLYLDAAKALVTRTFNEPEIAVAASLAEAQAAIADGTRFEIVLADYSMPGMNGVDGVRALVAGARDTPVVVMSGVADRDDVRACLTAGAKGFLPKTLEPGLLSSALTIISQGGSYVPVELISGEGTPAPSGSVDVRNFSGRELALLQMLGEGNSNKEIARRLDLQEVTIKVNLTRLFTKLGAKNRAQAVAIAIKSGLLRKQG